MSRVPRTLDEIRDFVHLPAVADLGSGCFCAPITEDWQPRTEAHRLGHYHRQDIDRDGDGVNDIRATLKVSVLDANGNGVIGDVGDEIRGRTVAAELLDPNGPEFTFTTFDSLCAFERWLARQ